MGETTESVEAHPQEEKKPRKRLKQLCSQIRSQMEFYFSDANLHKDRFIKKLTDQSSDGYIELKVFTDFNKLKMLTTDVTLIAKALSSSKMLGVNEDKTKVRRVTPVGDQKDVDDRTVYVEYLPLSVDHDWVKKIFGSCGNVVYVSLPKYRTTGDLKGFAFVEFETQEGANKACEMLNNPPATAQDKPGMFPKTKKQLDLLKNQVALTQPEELENIDLAGRGKKGCKRRILPEENKEEGNKLSRRARKRQRSISECSNEHDSDGSPVKRRVSDISVSDSELTEVRGDKMRKDKRKRKRSGGSEGDVAESSSVQEIISDTPCQKVRKVAEEETDDCEETGVELGEVAGKTSDVEKAAETRKRTSLIGSDRDCREAKRVKISDEVEVCVTEFHNKRRKKKKKINKKDTEVPEIRVILKQDWLELRAEYLQLQRASMRKLKAALTQNRQTALNARAKSKKEEEKTTQQSSAPTFTPGVILKVMAEKEIHRKQLKELLNPVGQVAYVDVLEGCSDGHIRCADAESATHIIQAEVQNHTFSLLTGDEETKYWSKLANDREQKLNSKTKSKRRGRDKVLKQADAASTVIKRKHVVFGED